MLKARSTFQYHVTFRGCGAEHHPAFSQAIRMENGMFRIYYNVYSKDLLMSKKAQLGWSERKCLHLRSWGEIGQIGISEIA